MPDLSTRSLFLTVAALVLADADAVQMLTRNTQVGEFYYMHPPKTMGSEWYPNMLDMIIYDEEADKHVRISWKDAMDATFVNDAGLVGGVGQVTMLATEGVDDPTKNTLLWKNKCRAWSEWNETGALETTYNLIELAAAPADSKKCFEELTKYDYPCFTFMLTEEGPEHLGEEDLTTELMEIYSEVCISNW